MPRAQDEALKTGAVLNGGPEGSAYPGPKASVESEPSRIVRRNDERPVAVEGESEAPLEAVVGAVGVKNARDNAQSTGQFAQSRFHV